MRLIKGKAYYTKEWYNSYRSMMDRCYRKKAHNYSLRYGKRITYQSNGYGGITTRKLRRNWRS